MPTITFGDANDVNDVNNLNNFGFEFSDYNETLDFNVPTYWEHKNYTAVVNHFNRDINDTRLDWKLPVDGLYPYEGNSFVVLSTGDMTPDPNFAEIRQRITIGPGDRLTGAYFFGTADWIQSDDHWNDTGYIQLVQPDTNIVEVNIIEISVKDVNSCMSMRGWKRFDYIFDANQAGTYDLKIWVFDRYDYIWSSYLVVDGLVICPNSPIFGDINADCTVNFLDFTMLASDWMCDCSNLATFNDPNHNCVYGTDLDNSNMVDFNDLKFITDYWLISTLQGVIEE
jgi:hypothetical protein